MLAGMSEEGRSLARLALGRLSRKPKPVWVEMWRWAIAVEHATGTVYLVPSQTQPLLVARLPRDRFDGAGVQPMPRLARDAICGASCAGDAVWVEWELLSESSLNAVLGVLDAE
jgi:hypothetical protein